MDFNFTLPPPKPASLVESHQLIQTLWSYCLSTKSALFDLQEKARTNSSNSSQPPSTDSIKDKAVKCIERDTWRKRSPDYWKRRQHGAQPGHKGVGRALVSIDEVDTIIPCYPEKTCLTCGIHVKIEKVCQRKQVFDLPVGTLHVTEYQVYSGKCLQCKRQYRGKLPGGVPKGILGANALAKIAVLTGKYRLSKREVKEFLFDFFGLTVCVGTISNAEHRVSQALKSPVEDIGNRVSQAGHLHLDETSHNHKGNLEWLWVASNDKLTYFKIYQHRNQTCAKALIGEKFSGMVITDRYGAYNWLSGTQRQYCWAHIKRDFKKVADREDPEEAYIGTCLLSSLESIFYYWRGIRDGTSKSHHYSFMRGAIRRLYTYLKRGRRLKGTKTATLCAKLIRERQSLWHFLRLKNIDATNNHAERQLRHAVIWRKKCYGTQSKRGIEFVERILSVVMTCKQQDGGLTDWLSRNIEAYWQGKVADSLIS